MLKRFHGTLMPLPYDFFRDANFGNLDSKRLSNSNENQNPCLVGQVELIQSVNKKDVNEEEKSENTTTKNFRSDSGLIARQDFVIFQSVGESGQKFLLAAYL